TGTTLVSWDYGVLYGFTFPNGFKFPFEGQDRTQAMMGNGYIRFAMSSDSDFDSNSNNPSTFPSLPGGIIAAFWDDFGYTDHGLDKWVYQYRDPDNNPATRNGYLIIQWHRVDFLGTSPDAEVNVQLKLFESGDIEVHWGNMLQGAATAGRIAGDSATVGLSNVAGTQAVTYSHNEAKVSPNTAIRFKAQ
ncbi:MAG: hypothetical protein ACK4N5_08050, partial [Myxococcales bacterium]